MHKSIWIVNYKYVDIAKISINARPFPQWNTEYHLKLSIYLCNEPPTMSIQQYCCCWLYRFKKVFSLNQMWVLQNDGVSPSFFQSIASFHFSSTTKMVDFLSYNYIQYTYTFMYTLRFDRSDAANGENWIDRLFPISNCIVLRKIDLTNNIRAIAGEFTSISVRTIWSL